MLVFRGVRISDWVDLFGSVHSFHPHPLHSLKLTASLHLKTGLKRPKRKGESLPTIHFQVLLLLVSGSRVTGVGTLKDFRLGRLEKLEP